MTTFTSSDLMLFAPALSIVCKDGKWKAASERCSKCVAWSLPCTLSCVFICPRTFIISWWYKQPMPLLRGPFLHYSGSRRTWGQLWPKNDRASGDVAWHSEKVNGLDLNAAMSLLEGGKASTKASRNLNVLMDHTHEIVFKPPHSASPEGTTCYVVWYLSRSLFCVFCIITTWTLLLLNAFFFRSFWVGIFLYHFPELLSHFPAQFPLQLLLEVLSLVILNHALVWDYLKIPWTARILQFSGDAAHPPPQGALPLWPHRATPQTPIWVNLSQAGFGTIIL